MFINARWTRTQRVDDVAALPRITVVTPSYNQAAYLERTIKSVLTQNYPNLEYIIVDGGSTDGSVEIIRRYANHLAWWVSEQDGGQTEAINKGLKRATGEWVAWQNSDDIYYPGAFQHLASAAAKHPRATLITGDMMLIDAADHTLREMRYVRPTYGSLIAEGMVLTNQSAFWRRELHAEIGWLNESFHYGFDYEWFLRVLKHSSQTAHIPKILGGLRYHTDTKTSQQQEKFKTEYAQITNGQKLPVWKKRLYQIRRMLLTLANGHWRYVVRGLYQRALFRS